MINHKQNASFPSSKPLKYLMSAIPELIAIATLCFVGVKTRHIKKAFKASKYTQVEGMAPSANGLHGDRVPLTYMPPQQDGVYEPYKRQYPQQTVAQNY
jgi:hypothetical protein